ncbi:MAG: 50S ribosomal protein L18 [Planctomycetota bacterium]
MERLKQKRMRRQRRLGRVRSRVHGTAERPRLSVFRSLKGVYAQVIDDDRGVTLFGLSTRSPAMREGNKGKKKIDAAKLLGKALAKEAVGKGIQKIVFDRGPYRYHGRVKSVAEGAREGGLKF